MNKTFRKIWVVSTLGFFMSIIFALNTVSCTFSTNAEYSYLETIINDIVVNSVTDVYFNFNNVDNKFLYSDVVKTAFDQTLIKWNNFATSTRFVNPSEDIVFSLYKDSANTYTLSYAESLSTKDNVEYNTFGNIPVQSDNIEQRQNKWHDLDDRVDSIFLPKLIAEKAAFEYGFEINDIIGRTGYIYLKSDSSYFVECYISGYYDSLSSSAKRNVSNIYGETTAIVSPNLIRFMSFADKSVNCRIKKYDSDLNNTATLNQKFFFQTLNHTLYVGKMPVSFEKNEDVTTTNMLTDYWNTYISESSSNFKLTFIPILIIGNLILIAISFVVFKKTKKYINPHLVFLLAFSSFAIGYLFVFVLNRKISIFNVLNLPLFSQIGSLINLIIFTLLLAHLMICVINHNKIFPPAEQAKMDSLPDEPDILFLHIGT